MREGRDRKNVISHPLQFLVYHFPPSFLFPIYKILQGGIVKLQAKSQGVFFFLPSCELRQCQPDFLWYFAEVWCFIQLKIHKSSHLLKFQGVFFYKMIKHSSKHIVFEVFFSTDMQHFWVNIHCDNFVCSNFFRTKSFYWHFPNQFFSNTIFVKKTSLNNNFSRPNFFWKRKFFSSKTLGTKRSNPNK